MQEKPQLRMIWPQQLVGFSELPASSGYHIRTYRPGDEVSFLGLMDKGDFDPWNDEKLQANIAKILPESWFFAVETKTEDVVGTAMCMHNYSGQMPFTGEVGWVACDPNHRGHGLGYFLVASVTARFLDIGYKRIQLYTEIFRLSAIKTYLKLGYLPDLGSPAKLAAWKDACEQVGWPFTPDQWQQEYALQKKIWQ
jgi:mycothiol synthase